MFFKSSIFAAALVAAPLASQATTVILGDTGGDAPVSTVQASLALTPLIQTGGIFDDIGQVRWFAGNFAPRGYALADGSIVNITDNIALFSKLGTTYGGDGRTTFGLPDLRGRTIVGTGGQFRLGQTMGSSTVTLTESNLPSHTHNTATGPSSATGGGTSYNNMQPGLALDYEVTAFGAYPPSSDEPGNTLGFVTIDAANDGAGGGFGDNNKLPAEGALLSISSNPALFSLYGTTYGGDGRTTFGLPDTVDRIVVGEGNGPGLDPRNLGAKRGANQETLTVSEMPSHTHSDPQFGSTGPTGGGTPENNVQKEIALNYLIALQGIFPSRDGGVDSGSGSYGTPFLGEIALFGGNFAPRGWAFAHGQILPINQNQSLYSILGTQFGGDGRTTFALPDLRGRTAIGAGFGPLGSLLIGTKLGFDDLGLSVNNLPSHNHTVDRAVIPLPAGMVLLLTGLAGLGMVHRRKSNWPPVGSPHHI